MNQTLIQVFYEIAMTIGGSPRLDPMLRESLSAYLRKLNCSTGMVLQDETDADGFTGFRAVAAIPRRVQMNSAVEEVLRRLPGHLDAAALEGFLGTLPFHFHAEGGRHGHLMRLRDFGLLLLVKSGEPLEATLLKSLARLNDSLASACRVCLQNEETVRINERLSREIGERVRAEAERQKLLEELESRVEERTADLVRTNRKLEESLANVKTLGGLLPICSVCKNVRDGQGYWKQIETYVSSHSDAVFSHSYCPECAKKLRRDLGLPEE
jgi:hypothetical protein